jgi:hypothetical protein
MNDEEVLKINKEISAKFLNSLANYIRHGAEREVNKLFGNLHAVIRQTLPIGSPKEIDAKFNSAINSVLKDKDLYEIFIQREINRVVDNLYLNPPEPDNESK